MFIERIADIGIHLCALAIEHENNRLQIEQLILFDPLNGLPNSKRTARTVLMNDGYSVGRAMRQGSSSLTRFAGHSAMTSST